MPKLCKSIKRKYPSNSTLLKTFLPVCVIQWKRFIFKKSLNAHNTVQYSYIYTCIHIHTYDDSQFWRFHCPEQSQLKSNSDTLPNRSHQSICQTLICLGFLGSVANLSKEVLAFLGLIWIPKEGGLLLDFSSLNITSGTSWKKSAQESSNLCNPKGHVDHGINWPSLQCTAHLLWLHCTFWLIVLGLVFTWLSSGWEKSSGLLGAGPEKLIQNYLYYCHLDLCADQVSSPRYKTVLMTYKDRDSLNVHLWNISVKG